MSNETYERPQPDAVTRPAFAPFGSTVILKPIRPEVQEKTAGGIILPESVKDAEKNKPISAIALYEVVAVGRGVGPHMFPPTETLEVGIKVWVKSYVADSFDAEASFVAVDVKDIWAEVLL